MNIPTELKFTKDHEWVRVQGETLTMGITEYAQDELGEIVFVEFPDPESEVSHGDSFCVVESTKAASDVYAPVTGMVADSNSELEENPSLVNESPYEKGWLVKYSSWNQEEVDKLMDSVQYENFIG